MGRSRVSTGFILFLLIILFLFLQSKKNFITIQETEPISVSEVSEFDIKLRVYNPTNVAIKPYLEIDYDRYQFLTNNQYLVKGQRIPLPQLQPYQDTGLFINFASISMGNYTFSFKLYDASIGGQKLDEKTISVVVS